MAEAQIALRERDLQAQSQGLDGLIFKEYTTGERAGMMTILGIPTLQLEGMNDLIETLTEDLEQDNEEN
jgi:hypothetical protein